MYKLLAFFVLALAIGLAYFKLQKVESPVISLSSGKVVGFVSLSRDGNEFYSYVGIPYARPPIGDLRFQPAQPAEPWSHVLKAQTPGSPCLQADSLSWKVIGAEDCLYINAYRPKGVEGGEGALLPVMVYVHGGYFMTGTGHNQQPKYMMDEQVVMVTFNYRLGALGFLSTGDSVVQGNNGLKDQVLALKWVQENIQAFGGDPKQVTLWGESAGASSVHFHMLSPMSKGLFHRAISQSGTAFKVWSLSTKAKEQSIRLGQRLNCPTGSSGALVQCLKTKDAYTIAETQLESITPLIDPLYMYAPVVESQKDLKDVFLPDHPYKIMVEGKYQPVPWLCGMNSHEGLLVTGRVLLDQNLIDQLENDWKRYLPKYLVYDPSQVSLTEQIFKFYTQESLPPEKLNFTKHFDALTDLVSDRLYIYAQREAAFHHSKRTEVYLYFNKYKGEQSFTIFFGYVPNVPHQLQFLWKLGVRKLRRLLGYPEQFAGVCHGDDLFLMFNGPLMEIWNYNKDYDMSRTIVKTWAQFARGEKKLMVKDKEWTPVPRDSGSNRSRPLKYMTFRSSNESNMEDEEFTDRMNFWQSLNLSWID